MSADPRNTRFFLVMLLLACLASCSDSLEVQQTTETARYGQILYWPQEAANAVIHTRIYDTVSQASTPFVTGYVTSVAGGNVAFTAYNESGRAVADCVCDYRSLHAHAVTPLLGEFDLLGPAVLSSDGKLLCYTLRDPSQTGGRLVLAKADGTNARSLADDVLFPCLPSISPKGDRVAYFSIAQKLVVVQTDGSGKTNLADIAARPGPDAVILWGASDVIAYLDYVLLHTFDMRSHVKTDVFYRGIPAWSPDGKTLAICDNNSVILSSDEGQTFRPAFDAAGTTFYSDVRWSASGSSLIVTRAVRAGSEDQNFVSLIDTASHRVTRSIPAASHGLLLY